MLQNDIDLNMACIENDFYDWYYTALHEVQTNKMMDWKQSMLETLKGYIAQFAQYAIKQNSQDIPFLQQNQMIIGNTKQYPVKPENAIKNATNYTSAIQRLNTPLSTNLNGIDLNRVDVDNKTPQSNMAIKKSIIPSYNGKQDFATFAKLYYYGGEGARQNLNPQQIAVLLQTAMQFCNTYESRVKSLQTDFNGIMNYINQDTSGMPNQQNMQTAIQTQQNNQQTPAAQTMASTSPKMNTNNTVNAAVEYENFMKDYFGDNWEYLVEADITKPTGNSSSTQPIKNKSMNPTPLKQNASQQQTQSINTNNKPSVSSPNGTPVKVDQNALMTKKKQIVCDIVKDAFAAKLSALGMVYHDFIFLIRRHVASYRGPEAVNQGNSNQQQVTPPQMQNNNNQGGK